MFRGPDRIVAVVDDDSAVLDSVQDLLESGGFSVRSFLSAEEFLQGDALQLIGCLISDIQLPGMDGWALEAVVKDRRPLLPTILITAHGDLDQLRSVEGEHRAARLAFMKPFDGRQLLEAVERMFFEIRAE
jgi:FixJ family two-component response regulator